MIELSERTTELIWRIFDRPDWDAATALLEEECADNLPLVRQWDPTPASMERLRFAALKLSAGNLDGLRKALAIAKQDWRDLLMAAEFGDQLDAHKRWAEELINGNGTSV